MTSNKMSVLDPLEIEPTCLNCRNQDSSVCNVWNRQKRDFLIRRGHLCKKAYCKFWSYQPQGMWKTNHEQTRLVVSMEIKK